MRLKLILSVVTAMLITLTHAQKKNQGSANKSDEPVNPSTMPRKISERISFLIGPGASILTKTIYEDPTVNLTNNSVIINEASKLKTNLAIGITYTPYFTDITRTKKTINAQGKVEYKEEVESVNKGFTYAAFLNPISITNSTGNQSFFNMLDFGVGFGYKTAGGFSFLGTAEFFNIRQPRKWFIEEFKNNNKPYIIDQEIQKSIDVTDSSIFHTTPVLTFGFKVCYTFDIIKSFMTEATLTE